MRNRSATVTIHAHALQHNLLQARQAAPDSKVMAVIKANAYGHGAVNVAGILYPFTDAYAVSCISEAMELRDAKIDRPVTVLQGPQNDNELRIAADASLRLVIHDESQLMLLDHFSGINTRFDVSIKLDTGMHRLGFAPENAAVLYHRLKKLPHVNPDSIGLMTHLSCADDLDNDYTATQIKQFRQATAHLALEKSIANSAGILGWPKSHADWIRPGIMLYGSSPFCSHITNRMTPTHVDSVSNSNISTKPTRSTQYDLRASMTFGAPVIAVHMLKKGDRIGYGATWQCPEDMAVGVIACGYADGYPRHAGTGTPVWLNGIETQLLGRVSMDMICVDLRQIPQTKPGDMAELWGSHLQINRIAQHAETISYELLCNAGNSKA